MEWTLEVVSIPVTDVDRAKNFYVNQCGFRADLDTSPFEGARLVQITPPGSRCSIVLESGLPDSPGQPRMTPGSLQGLQVCVTDIEAARKELVDRGVVVGPVQHVGPSGWEDGKGDDAWNSFVFFQDLDGNGWVVQEAPKPLTDR